MTVGELIDVLMLFDLDTEVTVDLRPVEGASVCWRSPNIGLGYTHLPTATHTEPVVEIETK